MDIKDSEFSPPVQVMDGQNLSMDLFYKIAADTAVCFKDGQILKFNKTAFVSIVKSRVLYQIFFGPLKVEETKIDDLDYDTFKLFLDCIMGYKKLNFLNAFKIFPVFHKYQVEHLISECIDWLIPNVLNEKVCDVLNLAAFYSCDELIEKLNKFLASNNIPEFLEDKKHYQRLQPDAWKIILNSVTIDSGLLIILAQWGMNYIEENSLNFETSKHFFEKYDLLKYFNLQYFETTGEIFEFCFSESSKDIFTFKEALLHLQISDHIPHRKSKWTNVEKNGKIVERIPMPRIKNGNFFLLQVEVKRNRAVFYHEQLPEGEKRKEKNRDVISCEIQFIGGMERCENTYKLSERDIKFHMTDFQYSRKAAFSGAYFDITWTFLQKSRVLLTTRQSEEPMIEEMYFTKDISACF